MRPVVRGTPQALAAVRLITEVAFGVVAYDFIFFWLHLGMHRLPRVRRTLGRSDRPLCRWLGRALGALGGLLRHGQHHSWRRTELSAVKVLDHSLLDGVMQVGCGVHGCLLFVVVEASWWPMCGVRRTGRFYCLWSDNTGTLPGALL